MGFGNWSTPGSPHSKNNGWDHVGSFFGNKNSGPKTFLRTIPDSPDLKGKRIDSYDPREFGENRMSNSAMYRAAVFDTGAQIGSSSGYKWQPVSDLEWVRLFERYWFNKRVTMSHSDSYIFESNPGKPKMVRKGQGKKGRGAAGGVAMVNMHGRKPDSKSRGGTCKHNDRKHMKRE